jgi:molybdopterin/thiamine biosynthesis adenylyltransferase
MAFSDAELERYARHIVLREIGGPGQARLKAASVLVVGAGGLGSASLMYLAAAGVGRIAVADDDAVSLSNLQRQVLHRTEDVGRPKVESAADALARLNPEVTVEPLAVRLGPENAAGLVAGRDLVVDGSDSFATRALVNAACVEAGVPLVSGAIGQWEGQLSVFDPARGGPCLACVFPEAPAPGLAPSCAEGGVLGALAGVFGALQAAEAAKLLAGAGEPLRGRMLLLDLLHGETRTMRLRAEPGCRVCGGRGAGGAGRPAP